MRSEGGVIWRGTLRFRVDPKSMRTRISRKVALRYAWQSVRVKEYRTALDWIKTAWRGWYIGTIYNAGA